MRQLNNIFIELKVLEDKKLFSLDELNKRGAKLFDSRYLIQEFNKLLEYNSDYFSFLGLNYQMEGSDSKASLVFSSSRYIGCIPIRSHGKYPLLGDVVVWPQYNKSNSYEDLINIITCLDIPSEIETINSPPLKSGKSFSPPMYYEAIKFIKILSELSNFSWRKFKSEEINVNAPQGNVNWSKYALTEYNPNRRLIFPIKKNVINEFHEEYGQLKYIYEICKNEILSFRTPISSKIPLQGHFSLLDNKLYFHKSININRSFKVNSYDHPTVKSAKLQANVIIERNFSLSQAWRLDISLVFERWVQYLFSEVGKRIGGVIMRNYKYYIQGNSRAVWDLKYLEPDLIFKAGNIEVVVDAKYKSHLFNRDSQSEKLKDDYRADLHQLLAYSAFQAANIKHAFLVYPYSGFTYFENSYQAASISNVKLFKLGIPFSFNEKERTIEELSKLISSLSTSS